MRVAVIDDNDGFRRLVARVATGIEGVTVASYADGADFLADLEREDEPDLIVLDILMRHCDGIDVVRELVKTGFTGAICVMTAGPRVHAMAAEALAKAHGVNVVKSLAKPVSINELRQVFLIALDGFLK